MDIIIRYVNTMEEALEWAREGSFGVECAFGNDSMVTLGIDHHGKYSDGPPVALQAFHLAKAGVRIKKFVVTGMPDVDAISAICILAWKIIVAKEEVEAIAEADVDYRGKDPNLFPYRRAFVLRSQTLHLPFSSEGFSTAVKIAIEIWNSREAEDELFSKAIVAEKKRLEMAREAIIAEEDGVLLVDFPDVGQEVWFEIAPLIVRYDGCHNVIVLHCDISSPLNPFGPDGLKKVYPALGLGWGGRENMGGSPRSQKMTLEDAEKVFNKMQELYR